MKFRGTIRSINNNGRIKINFKDVIEVNNKKIIVNVDLEKEKENQQEQEKENLKGRNYLLDDLKDKFFNIEAFDTTLFYQFYKERELLILKFGEKEKNEKNGEYKIIS